MNLKLAEIIESIPKKFAVTYRTYDSVRYSLKNRDIIICWYDNGQPKDITYYSKGKYHRPSREGPAYQEWYDNGQIWKIFFCKNGLLHRPIAEGPAMQEWRDTGKPSFIKYLENGKQVSML